MGPPTHFIPAYGGLSRQSYEERDKLELSVWFACLRFSTNFFAATWLPFP